MQALVTTPPKKSRWWRKARQVGGFLLIITGVPMLILPGPGGPAILFGLNLLAEDYAWAERLRGKLLAQTKGLLRRFPKTSARWQHLSQSAAGLRDRIGRRHSRRRGQSAKVPKNPE